MKRSLVHIPRLAFFKDDIFLSELAARLLFFTVSVVLLACVTFAFGGTCAAWQWHLPLVVVALAGGLPRWRSAFAFLTVIAVMWFVAPLWLDSYGYCDMPAYHLPMVRLLSFGWNPFVDPEAHGICAKLGLDWWGMRPYHVAYCSKPAAIFSAVAYSFVRDPYALTYPLPFLLLVSVCTTSLRVFHRSPIAIPALAMLLMWCFLPRALFVDCSLMLASTGLLLTMYANLRDNTHSFIPLAGYGFWMINLKLPGVLAAGVFFTVFTIASLWRNRDRRTLLCFMHLVTVLVFASCLVSFNPYGTSFRDKGHPLYPFKTVDEAKFPVCDICVDFKEVNDDAAQMGRLGTLVNSYVSPRLARSYYNYKLRRTDFAPHKLVWDYRWHDDQNIRVSPTTTMERGLVLLTMLLLLSLPYLRTIGIGMLLLTVGFPFEQIGFLRYQPWIYAAFSLSVSVLALKWVQRQAKFHHLLRVFVVVGVMLVIACQLNSDLNVLGVAVEDAKSMPTEIFSCYEQPNLDLPQSFRNVVARFLDRRKTHSLNLILRNRQLGVDGAHRVVCADDEDLKKLGLVKSRFGYYVRGSSKESISQDKWTRVLGRLGNICYLPACYGRRVRRVLFSETKGVL